MQGHAALTLGQDPCLIGDVSQVTNDFLIAFLEPIQRVRDVDFLAKLHDKLLASTQVVSRDAREQMVYRLELQAAVKEVEPLWAIDVHSGPQHALREGFGDAEVCG